MRQFDEAYTAPHHGFRDATDYYHRASAMRVIDRIRVPALIMTAADDPFVPASTFRDPSVTGNPNITMVITRTAAIARTSSARRPATTATGPSGRSSASPSTTSRDPERLHQERRELRPFPRLFVLEVDEDVAAA